MYVHAKRPSAWNYTANVFQKDSFALLCADVNFAKTTSTVLQELTLLTIWPFSKDVHVREVNVLKNTVSVFPRGSNAQANAFA